MEEDAIAVGTSVVDAAAFPGATPGVSQRPPSDASRMLLHVGWGGL